MPVQEVRLQYSGPGHNPKFNIFHVDNLSAPGPFMEAWSAAMNVIKAYLTPELSWTWDPQVRELDTSTGRLLGVDTVTPPAGGTGSGTGQVTPDSNQVLVQWRTGQVLGGRQIRGRTFIPGLTLSNVLDGNLAPNTRTAIANAAQDALDPDVGMVVWSRRNGSVVPVNQATVWAEIAVQRRRRG